MISSTSIATGGKKTPTISVGRWPYYYIITFYWKFGHIQSKKNYNKSIWNRVQLGLYETKSEHYSKRYSVYFFVSNHTTEITLYGWIRQSCIQYDEIVTNNFDCWKENNNKRTIVSSSKWIFSQVLFDNYHLKYASIVYQQFYYCVLLFYIRKCPFYSKASTLNTIKDAERNKNRTLCTQSFNSNETINRVKCVCVRGEIAVNCFSNDHSAIDKSVMHIMCECVFVCAGCATLYYV